MAATDDEDDSCFSMYVLPKRPISQKASEVTELTFYSSTNSMHLNGARVPAVSISEALNLFISYLHSLPSCGKRNLVGYNIKIYDYLVATNALKNCNLITNFHAEVTGYKDTPKLLSKSESEVLTGEPE